MLYEKKYVLIKDENNNILGFVHIEKDGKIKVKYSLSVFSFFCDIYVVKDSKIIKKISNVNISGTVKLNLDNFLNLGFVFVSDNKFFAAGDIDANVIAKIKSLLDCGSSDSISLVVNRIFMNNYCYSFYENIEKPLMALFEEADEFCGFDFSYNSSWVRIETGRGEEIVGKLYDKFGKFIILGIGLRVDNILQKNNTNILKAKNNEWYLINFYDIFTGKGIFI